jgi:hypothetical protein
MLTKRTSKMPAIPHSLPLSTREEGDCERVGVSAFKDLEHPRDWGAVERDLPEGPPPRTEETVAPG